MAGAWPLECRPPASLPVRAALIFLPASLPPGRCASNHPHLAFGYPLQEPADAVGVGALGPRRRLLVTAPGMAVGDPRLPPEGWTFGPAEGGGAPCCNRGAPKFRGLCSGRRRCRCSRHATHATATRHDRHTAPARHVGRRVTREAAAVTQQASPRRVAAAADRSRARPVDRSRARSKVGERRGSVRTPTTAHSAKPTSAPDLTGHAVT